MPGTTICAGPSQAVCVAPDFSPNAETCNGLDDDCDGVIDDGFGLGEPCAVGVGACAAKGELVCDGPSGTTCDAVPGEPGIELCGDEVDEDCDGELDNGCPDPPAPPAPAPGSLQGSGLFACRQGQGEGGGAWIAVWALAVAAGLRRRA